MTRLQLARCSKNQTLQSYRDEALDKPGGCIVIGDIAVFCIKSRVHGCFCELACFVAIEYIGHDTRDHHDQRND